MSAALSPTPHHRIAHARSLAEELARPVARGMMSRSAAIAALALANDRAMQAGTAQGNGSIEDRLKIDVHVLDLHAAKQRQIVEGVEHDIRRVIKPLIANLAPPNQILAEAHNVNGDAGFALTEAAVTDIVRNELYWSMQKRPATPQPSAPSFRSAQRVGGR